VAIFWVQGDSNFRKTYNLIEQHDYLQNRYMQRLKAEFLV